MADFKFSCPHCQQHIQCDTGYSGMQINCPACQKTIVVPQGPPSVAAPRAVAPPPPPSAAPPPPPPGASPALATKQTTAAPAAGKRFSGAPTIPGAAAVPQKKKSGALKAILSVVAALVGAAVGFFAVQYFMGNIGHGKAAKENPAAQVAAPTTEAVVKALSILSKMHSAYTNMDGTTVEGTFTMFLDVSNITLADVNPGMPAGSKTADRHPQGMPRVITNTTEVTVRGARALSNWYYFAGEAVSKVDHTTVSNTFASWSSDKGKFTFSDSHMKGMPARYQQLPDVTPESDPMTQFKNMQHLFEDPANLTKIIKDLGQTGDESVSGQDCYTLTAKVLGQKVKIWVDKTSYLVWQWQIILGGKISDADVDDAVSLFTAAMTNVPPQQMDIIKVEIKKRTPAMTKVRGTLTFTSSSIRQNLNLSAEDFYYAVPSGVRLIQLNARPVANAGAAAQSRQRNTCINNLRQIDSARQQWALEKGKPNGTVATEADITPYLVGKKMPTCPAGGTYTIGKVGEKPTCSIPGHALP